MRAVLLLAILVLAAAPAARGQYACMPTGFADPPTTLPREQPAPTYPAEAQALGIEGRVIVKLHVGVDGRVASATVQRGVHALLDSAALTAVRAWQFEPVTCNGVPIEVEVSAPVRFRTRVPVAVPLARLPVRALPGRVASTSATVDTAACAILVMPNPVRQVPPEYPAELREWRGEGRVLARVLVTAEGRVREVVAEEIEGDRAFVRPTLHAIWQWRFTPATCDGVPFEIAVSIPMLYRTNSSSPGYRVQRTRRY